jgi:hypothetical protein
MATALSWVPVQGGQWTRIFQGPSIHIFGVEVLELTAARDGQGAYVVSFTLRRASAVIPFYLSVSNSRTAAPQGTFPLPLSSTYFVPAGTSSPWTEMWFLSDTSCRAHILI